MSEQITNKIITEKILYILDNFPKVTPSMLQISLGSGIPTSLWRPVLENLVKDELVYRYQKITKTPTGRSQVLTILSSDPEPESIPTNEMLDPDFENDE